MAFCFQMACKYRGCEIFGIYVRKSVVFKAEVPFSRRGHPHKSVTKLCESKFRFRFSIPVHIQRACFQRCGQMGGQTGEHAKRQRLLLPNDPKPDYT